MRPESIKLRPIVRIAAERGPEVTMPDLQRPSTVWLQVGLWF